jgi:hypothetical protein
VQRSGGLNDEEGITESEFVFEINHGFCFNSKIVMKTEPI